LATRLTLDQKSPGSTPGRAAELNTENTETHRIKDFYFFGAFRCLSKPLSSRGLGRRPLKAETRVQIPLAVRSTSPNHTRKPTRNTL
jgi:hypothetical protein